MATPRQKVQVGVFLVVCGVLLLGTLVVLTGLNREQAVPYRIAFDESVSGLNVGSDVRYRGVLVGRVTDVRVNPNNKIDVHIEVRPSALQVRAGMTAQLNATGVTGQLFINLAGGAPSGDALPPDSVIPAIPSLLTNIATSLPSMLSSTNNVLLRLEKTFGQGGQVGHLLDATEKLLESLDTTLVEFSTRILTLVDRLDVLTSEELRPLFAELTATAKSTRLAIERTEPLLQETLTTSSQTLKRLDRQLTSLDTKGLSTHLQQTLKQLTELSARLARSSDELTLTLQGVRSDTSNVEFHFRQAVRSWRETLTAAKKLFDVLEQDPASLLIGRRAPARSRDGSER